MSTSTNPERAQRISGQSSTAEFRKHTGSDEELIRTLHKLDGRSYPAYKSVVGMWDFGSVSLSIDRIQADRCHFHPAGNGASTGRDRLA